MCGHTPFFHMVLGPELKEECDPGYIEKEAESGAIALWALVPPTDVLPVPFSGVKG